jgi:hypothetical protein
MTEKVVNCLCAFCAASLNHKQQIVTQLKIMIKNEKDYSFAVQVQESIVAFISQAALLGQTLAKA